MPQVTKRFIIDQTSDGRWNLLEVPPETDLTKGLPTGGEWFDNREEAVRAVTRRLNETRG